MILHRDRIVLARTLKKYIRLGLATVKTGEYRRIQTIKGCSANESEFYDLLAISDTLRTLGILGREEELRAFISVYLSGRRLTLSTDKNDVSLNALRFAMKNHCDVRTVYRRIACFEELYMKIRKSYK